MHYQPGRRSSLIVESSSEEDKDPRRSNGSFAVPLAATTSSAAQCNSMKKSSKSIASSSVPQRILSSPLREAFALAAAKSAAVKKEAARIPAVLTKHNTMPLATALKNAAALDSLQIGRYAVKA